MKAVDKSPNLDRKLKTYGRDYNDIPIIEVYYAVWQARYFILGMSFVFLMAALLYVSFSQAWWSSNAIVIAPQPKDYADFQRKVKSYQPLFNVYQDDGTVLVGEELDDLVDRESIFRDFVLAFNSNKNKRSFFMNNVVFHKYTNAGLLDDNIDGNYDKSGTKALENWYDKVSAVPVNKKDESTPYILKFKSESKEGSFLLLSEYISFISQRVNKHMLLNLYSLVDSKTYELKQQEKVLTTIAKLKLRSEASKTLASLSIAKVANVDNPVQIFSDGELFPINLGSKGLNEKINMLSKVEDLSIIEPKLHGVKAKLALVDGKVDRNIDYQSFYFIEEPQLPLYKDDFSTIAICALSIIFGGVLAIILIMLKYVVSLSKEDVSSK